MSQYRVKLFFDLKNIFKKEQKQNKTKTTYFSME